MTLLGKKKKKKLVVDFLNFLRFYFLILTDSLAEKSVLQSSS